jgi:hypothetical protein
MTTILELDSGVYYTFVRENKEKTIQQLLEFRDGAFNWTNDIENCLGFFNGDCLNPKHLKRELNECGDAGWKIYVNTFTADGQHIETITEEGT